MGEAKAVLGYDRVWFVTVGKAEWGYLSYTIRPPLTTNFTLAHRWYYPSNAGTITVELFVRNSTIDPVAGTSAATPP